MSLLTSISYISKIHPVFYLRKLGKPWIQKQSLTIADLQVSVLSTVRTEPFAVFATYRLHRQTQQDLLPDDITDLDKITKIESNFGIFLL